MAQLAIKGHPSRGSEVIALLKMLGGKEEDVYSGTEKNWVYTICREGYIDWDYPSNKYSVYTLEEFLEKFPYKIRDKVYYDNKVCDVIEMRWNSILNTISYGVCDGKNKNLAIVEELKPYRTEVMSKDICNSCLNLEGCLVYCSRKKQEMEKESKTYKEETMEELRIDFPEGYGYAGIENKQVIFTKIEPQYPKTYERCCNILKYSGNYYISLATKIDDRLFEAFYKLKVCRDAYWKIAGEQMGLGKPWQPDYTNPDIDLYVIINIYNRPKKARYGYGFQHCIFTFPTEEMRDAFYENFKDLIKECKELL